MTAPAPIRRTIQPRPGLDLVVLEAGAGTPVLVLHGGPGPDSVTTLLDHLSASHRVLAPTHPGWDGTVRPGDLRSVADLAAVYLDLLDHLDLSDVTVVGTSFGGWIAAEAILGDHQRRISRLVLMDAIGPAVPEQPITLPGPPVTAASPTAAAPAPRGGPPSQMLAIMRSYTGPHLQDPDLLGRLAAVTCPVLVIWGANDQVVTPAYGRAYAAAFPDARFEAIHDAGHLPIREQPTATFAALDSFLDSSTRRAASD